MKKLFIIDYECAHWCGGMSRCVVWAHNETEALLEAELFMEEHMRELFSDEYNDDYDEENEVGAYDNESAVSVNSVEEFTQDHEEWAFFLNPSQAEFYPVIGSQE